MYTSIKNEYGIKGVFLKDAMHQVITGLHQSFLIMRDKKIVNSLKLTEYCGSERPCKE